jgi:hypothetical protein
MRIGGLKDTDKHLLTTGTKCTILLMLNRQICQNIGDSNDYLGIYRGLEW